MNQNSTKVYYFRIPEHVAHVIVDRIISAIITILLFDSVQ